MITPLLDINTVPIEMRVTNTPARLEYDTTLQPTAQVHTEQGKINMRSHSVQLQLDTYEARKSLGMENSRDYARSAAQRGVDALNKKIQTTVQEGDQMAQTENGVTIADIVKQKMLQQPELITVFLPTGGANISWNPNSLDTQFQKGGIEAQWGPMHSKRAYTPGSYDVVISQYPRVDIEYLGGPAYVPPSANPEYEPAE